MVAYMYNQDSAVTNFSIKSRVLVGQIQKEVTT